MREPAQSPACLPSNASCGLARISALAPSTFLRGGLAGALAFTCARLVPHDSRLGAILALAAGAAAYAASLIATRELTKTDLERVLSIVKRRAA